MKNSGRTIHCWDVLAHLAWANKSRQRTTTRRFLKPDKSGAKKTPKKTPKQRKRASDGQIKRPLSSQALLPPGTTTTTQDEIAQKARFSGGYTCVGLGSDVA